MHKEEDAPEEDEEARVSDASPDWRPDLHWLSNQVAVGGCFPIEQAADLAAAHRINAVVDLRAEACDDEEQLRGAGIALLHLPTPDLEPPTVAMLDRGVEFVREEVARGSRVLIHCQHGIGRSPLLALCVLVDQGWAPLDALAYAKNLREAVSPSRLQYDGWCAWLASRGIKAPDYHTFGCVAYRHLGG